LKSLFQMHQSSILDKGCSMVISKDTLTAKIKEDIEFQRGINVKLNPEELSQVCKLS
jgi:hypothetical protein